VPRPVPLRPTFEHRRAAFYGRPGGPWDVPTLDVALSQPTIEIVDGPRRLGGADLEAAIAATAAWLGRAGVVPGDVVAWQLPNGLETYLLYRACWRIGTIAAPVHRSAGRADVTVAVELVRPDLIVAAPDLPAAELGADVVLEPGDPAWPPPEEAQAPPSPGPAPSDLAAVLFTSGSSGRPKAVLHTHRALVCKARGMTAMHALTPTDVVLMPAPLAHVSGLQNGVLVPGAAGMKTVLMARWEPEAALRLIEDEAVSFMIGPPTFFVSLMGAPDFAPERVRSLRLVSSGGSGVTPAFVASAAAGLDCRVKRTYGSTEAPTVSTSGPDDPPGRDQQTDGRPMGDCEVRISDPADGSPVATGTPGQVEVRGPELFEGYVEAEATAAAYTDDGWYHTGDLGRLDGDGWLTITGRMRDMIIRGGENISAAEVEGVLELHPAIDQAVAVGYPDDRLGQRVCAFVVSRTEFDLPACQAWMDERGVTRFKWPERVVRVDALPLLPAGKVDRAALERQAGGA
jgi:cyclohexanecarboxylate-CoA ligase